MKKAVVNFCSENGLALTQVLNLYIYFSLSPNITRIAFLCALKTGFNLEGLAPQSSCAAGQFFTNELK